MVWVLTLVLMLVAAALGAAAWGGEQTGAFLAAVFHILGSVAALRYLLSGSTQRREPFKGRRERPNFPRTEMNSAYDDEELNSRVDAILADYQKPRPPARSTVRSPAPSAAQPIRYDFPPDPPTHAFVTHCAVVNPNFQLAPGHSLELRPTANGIMEVCDIDGVLVVYVKKNLEDVGVDLKRLGLLSVFEICDESDMLLQDFPSGRLRLLNLKPAICAEYGDNLRLVEKGRLLVKRKS